MDHHDGGLVLPVLIAAAVVLAMLGIALLVVVQKVR